MARVVAAAAIVAASSGLARATTCTYPGGECYELNMEKCEGSDTLTMHGLWPQWQSECGSADFDESAIASIEDDMKKDWLSCPEYGGDNVKFWSHEWEKHGSCSGMDELTYFKTALGLYQKYKDGSQCQGGGKECKICFSKDLSTVEDCSDSSSSKSKPAVLV